MPLDKVLQDLNTILERHTRLWLEYHQANRFLMLHILGVQYNETADIWSFACTIFEMMTGDFLFDPKTGNGFDKDNDHLAQVIELIGNIPKNFALSGLESKVFKQIFFLNSSEIF